MAKELWEIRRENLQALIDCFPEGPGNRAALCRKYGLDPLQIGHYFTAGKGGRTMGEEKAREIESKIKSLKTGWLDHPHDVVTADVFDEKSPVAPSQYFLERMKGLQKEYDSMGPGERELVDKALGKKKEAQKLLKPKK